MLHTLLLNFAMWSLCFVGHDANHGCVEQIHDILDGQYLPSDSGHSMVMNNGLAQIFTRTPTGGLAFVDCPNQACTNALNHLAAIEGDGYCPRDCYISMGINPNGQVTLLYARPDTWDVKLTRCLDKPCTNGLSRILLNGGGAFPTIFFTGNNDPNIVYNNQDQEIVIQRCTQYLCTEFGSVKIPMLDAVSLADPGAPSVIGINYAWHSGNGYLAVGYITYAYERAYLIYCVDGTICANPIHVQLGGPASIKSIHLNFVGGRLVVTWRNRRGCYEGAVFDTPSEDFIPFKQYDCEANGYNPMVHGWLGKYVVHHFGIQGFYETIFDDITDNVPASSRLVQDAGIRSSVVVVGAQEDLHILLHYQGSPFKLQLLNYTCP